MYIVKNNFMIAESIIITIVICSFLFTGYVSHKLIVRSKCNNFSLEVSESKKEERK